MKKKKSETKIVEKGQEIKGGGRHAPEEACSEFLGLVTMANDEAVLVHLTTDNEYKVRLLAPLSVAEQLKQPSMR